MAAKELPSVQLSRSLRTRVRNSLRIITAAALTLGVSNCSFAQVGQTGFGQTGFGQTGLGQTGFGQPGGTGFGQTGQTGQAGGLGLGDSLSGGLGQSGQPGFGANPFSTGGLSGQAMTPYGRNGLIGAPTSGGTAGGMAAGAGGALGAANNLGGLTGAALNNRSLQGAFGGGRNAGRGGFNQNQNQNSTKSKIRATVKLGFESTPTTNVVATRAINDRLRRIPAAVLTGVSVEMSDRIAVIRGKVNSPGDGKVIERLLSLEPGIDGVKNELTYANGQAPAPPQPADSAQKQSPGSRAASSSVGISAVQVAPEIVPSPAPN